MNNWTLIRSDEALEEVLAQASTHQAVAVDTEFMRRNTFYPQIALLQICFSDTAWLIDPLTIEDLGPLIDFIEDRSVVKILHSASEDLEVFQHWLGVLPQPLFDTQKAAALLGRGFGMGYRALVNDICGVDLPKGETRSDWLQRPLTQSQCDYAALDVTHLLTIWHVLQEECEGTEKAQWVLDDGADAVDALNDNSRAYYKKIKKAWKLSARELGNLIAISEWRERTARTRDKPRSWIIDDKACLELAQRAPQSWSELKAEIDLPAPALRHYGEELLELLAEQRLLPDKDMPETLPLPLSAEQRNTLKTLKLAARAIAEPLNVVPEILLQSKDYELLIREAAGIDISVPVHWQGWRKEKVIIPLRKLLSGEPD